jgi:hypothetical protein
LLEVADGELSFNMKERDGLMSVAAFEWKVERMRLVRDSFQAEKGSGKSKGFSGFWL